MRKRAKFWDSRRSLSAPLLALFMTGVALPAEAQMRGERPERPAPVQPPAPTERWWDPSDPRIGLRAGVHDAGQAARNMELIATLPLPDGFSTNSDIAFGGDFAFLGNYNGFNVYDISNPRSPCSGCR
jgi:hypothetical protein